MPDEKSTEEVEHLVHVEDSNGAVVVTVVVITEKGLEDAGQLVPVIAKAVQEAKVK